MTDIERQVRAAREGALVQLAPELGTLVVTGRDRQTWLNGLVTCDLAPLAAGQGAFGLHVAKTGKIQAEMWIMLGKERLLAGVSRDKAEGLRDTLERYLIMEDAEVALGSDEHAWILVHGPLSGELLEVARDAGAASVKIDRTGLGGAAIVCAPGDAEAMIEKLLARAGERGARATEEGYARLCLELGMGRFGVDYDEENYPQEASLERVAVSFNKGCYLGQETVYMLEVRGHVKKKLVQILVTGEGAVARGAEIHAPDGALVGSVTSSDVSTTGQVIALGYVKYKLIAPGTELAIDGRAAKVAAR